MQQRRIIQEDSNEHVFIVIECPERPSISIDVVNIAGRRGVLIRIDGMGIMSGLVDVKELAAKGGEVLFRYCQFCGETLQLSSSRPHQCEEGIAPS